MNAEEAVRIMTSGSSDNTTGSTNTNKYKHHEYNFSVKEIRFDDVEIKDFSVNAFWSNGYVITDYDTRSFQVSMRGSANCNAVCNLVNGISLNGFYVC